MAVNGKNVHERAPRIVDRVYNKSFKKLLQVEKSLPIHQKNLQILATEISRTKNRIIPEIMN